MRHVHSSSSIFLMEIILNILLFSVMLVVGLQFFLQAHTQTAQTKALHQAVTSCESVAALFQSGDGTLEGLTASCPYSTKQNGQVRIYLDDAFQFCEQADASYYMTAELSSAKGSALARLRIVCYTGDREELYALTACHYTPIHSVRANAPAKEVS
jgi:hypothetical protein